MEPHDNWLDYLTAISTAVAAIGTLAAVVVALYMNVWREKRRQPALSVEISEETEFGAGWNPGERKDADVWGIPVLVGNAPGCRTAHGTEVLVAFGRRDDDGWYDYISDQSLIWKLARVPRDEGTVSIDIPAGVKRKLFVGFIGEANVLYRTLWPRVPAPGLFADDDGCEIAYGEGGKSSPVSPPIAGVLATYPFSQDDPFWFWRDEEYRMRLTLTSHDSDAVTYETLVTFAFTRRGAGKPREMAGQDFIQPVWSGFGRVDV